MDEKSRNFQYGRKVLFLNASSAIVYSTIPELVTREFDASFIPSRDGAEAVVAQFPGAILILNLDDGTGAESWIPFINALNDGGSDATPTVCVMYRGDSFDEAAFANKARFTGGFIRIADAANSLEPIAAALDGLNAKGRRKFVRADGTDDDKAVLHAIVDNKMYNLKCHDISMAGVSCTVDAKFAEAFPSKSLVRDATLTLERKAVSCQMLVVGSFPEGGSVKLVMMFASKISEVSETVIHSYILQAQQRAVDKIHTLAAPGAV
ncbi:MAG: hypothetical protein J1D88_09285 [Treponema sp.]|nr:hypothetical protein [Treponema sp.]